MPLELRSLYARITQALNTKSVEETSERLGLTKQSVYLWRKGKPPSLETLVHIADSSGVSLHWLITGEGEPSLIKAVLEKRAPIGTPLQIAMREAFLRDIEDAPLYDIGALSALAEFLESTPESDAKRIIRALFEKEVGRLLNLGLDAQRSYGKKAPGSGKSRSRKR